MKEYSSINIIKLTKLHLKSAIKLVNSVFSEEDEYPEIEIKASVYEKWFNCYVSKYDDEII